MKFREAEKLRKDDIVLDKGTKHRLKVIATTIEDYAHGFPAVYVLAKDLETERVEPYHHLSLKSIDT